MTLPLRAPDRTAFGGEHGLSPLALTAYALPATGATFLFTLVLVMYMKYGTDELGVSPGVLGALFFVTRVWDAVSDPAAGYLSDRTRSRFGRRRSWMLASTLPLAVFGVMVWAPPSALEGPALVGWIAVGLFGFYTAFTVFGVPHMALGAELTQNPRSRTRLFGVRQLLSQVGLLLAFAVGAPLVAHATHARTFALWVGVVAGVATAASIVWAVLMLPPERVDYAGRGGRSPIRALADVWRNPHARLLLFVFFVETLGMGGIGTMVPFVMQYVVKLPGLMTLALLTYVLPAIVSIPLWVALGNRFERSRVWLFAMGMSAVGFGSLIVFLGEGTVAPMLFAGVVSGTASGCGATLGQAIKADVIDWDEHQTHERKEGSYFAAWAFVGKLASGLMLGAVGLGLDWAGFVPGAEQTETVKRTMVFLMGGMPLLGFVVGMAAFSRFRLTRDAHARLMQEIRTRSTG